METGNSIKKRFIKYDFMRVLMSLFVICIHAGTASRLSRNNSIAILSNAISTFLLQCNGIFYMISGTFNLSKKFECKKDYIDYYISKFISIIIPYGIVSCLLVLAEIIVSEQNCNFNGYIYLCFEAFFSTNASSHLWFVCTLIGILIGTPFLAKLLSAMTDEEIKIMFGVGIIWNFIAIYLMADMGMKFGFNGWFLWGWIFVYFGGYFCDRVINDQNAKIIYGLGIGGFIITVFGMSYLEIFMYPTDLSVGFIFFVMSSYVFMQRQPKIKNESLKKVLCPIISYMAKYSFVAYMVHIIVLHQLESMYEGLIPIILLTFIFSYMISILVSNVLIKPIQVMVLKIMTLLSVIGE